MSDRSAEVQGLTEKESETLDRLMAATYPLGKREHGRLIQLLAKDRPAQAVRMSASPNAAEGGAHG